MVAIVRKFRAPAQESFFSTQIVMEPVPTTPPNGYITEDASKFYVAEDGTTFYVQET